MRTPRSINERSRPAIRSALRSALAIGLIAAGAGAIVLPGGAATGQTVSGTTYVDTNSNGARNGADPGLGGIQIRVTSADGTNTTGTSGSTGAYSVNLDGIGPGPFRVEYSGWASSYRPGPNGTGNPTSVVVSAAGGSQDFGVVDPDGYCQDNPQLVVTCFVAGTDVGTTKTLAQFGQGGAVETSAHNQSLPGPVGFDQPDEVTQATLTQTGGIYGAGYHPVSGSVFLGAYAKKYVPFGGGGSGAILVRRANGTIAPFWSTNSPTNRVPTNPTDWFTDPWVDQIGKTGWGDLDVIGNRLYAVNLEDRKLYVFQLDAAGALVGSGPTATFDIPSGGTVAGDSRPFGLGVGNGLLYVGGVDSKESTKGTPTAWVRSFDPATNNFGPIVTTFSLGFNRGCAYVAKTAINPGRCTVLDGGASWRPWGAVASSADQPEFGAFLQVNRVIRTEVNPQPMLSDIAFDSDGSMILGFRDRFGDQTGRYIPAGTVANPLGAFLPPVGLWLNGFAFGDTLRAAPANGGAFTIESGGTSGGVTGTAGGQGPGGGEFYDADNSLYNLTTLGANVLEGHDESTSGAVAYLPGTDEAATTAYDVFGRWDVLGIKYLTDSGTDAPNGLDSTDLNHRAQALYQGTLSQTIPFGKANGLGDLEALCQEAPLELGNFVWYDADGDGVQDPTELAIGGATVKLLGEGGSVLATAVTNAAGKYIFASAGAPNLPVSPGPDFGLVAGGITPSTPYTITFDLTTANLAPLGPLPAPLTPTTVGAAGNTIDNDAAVGGTGLPQVALVTGGPGSNDHTRDAGFRAQPQPGLVLVKSVNGQNANAGPGPVVAIGSALAFTYLVTNTTPTEITNIALVDDKLGSISCPKTVLAGSEAMTCNAPDTAKAGEQTNVGTVTGDYCPKTGTTTTSTSTTTTTTSSTTTTTIEGQEPEVTITLPPPPTEVSTTLAPPTTIVEGCRKVTSSDPAVYTGQVPTTTSTTTTAPPVSVAASTTIRSETTVATVVPPVSVRDEAQDRSPDSSPSSDLAFSGNSRSTSALFLGLGLILAGLGVMIAGRRRR